MARSSSRDDSIRCRNATTPFVIELTQFSGPLDLLLSLIRDEQVDIYDIPIARIAEQFLAHIRFMQLDQAADYLEMAARLLRIKAQMLLPRNELDDAWEDPRAELVRRLSGIPTDARSRRCARASAARNDAADSRARTFRSRSRRRMAPLALSLAELLAATDRVLRVAREPAIHDVVARPLDVDGAIETVRAVLALRATARWRDVCPPTSQPWQVLSALLALLELARRGELRLAQLAPFASVLISRESASQVA